MMYSWRYLKDVQVKVFGHRQKVVLVVFSGFIQVIEHVDFHETLIQKILVVFNFLHAKFPVRLNVRTLMRIPCRCD
jgi:hypothetical protein